ncbi:MAG: peptidase C13 [Proteobacteria bacterium]|nr:peptidase C13 [Pseudomonadota bacterium]
MNGRRPLLAGAFVAALALAFVAGRSSRPHVVAVPASRPAAVATQPASASQPAPAATASASVPTPAGLPDAADEAPPDIAAVASYEDLLYAQPDLVDAAIARVRPSVPGRPGLYALAFAGDAEENVFRNEAAYLPTLLARRFDAQDRTVQLVNSPYTFVRTPLATRSNLDQALAALAQRMDRDNDILLLFLTSHGSHDHQLLVEMGSLPLDQLTPQDIRMALDQAKIRWRVIVISACYSGGFIPALREPHTLVITAASADRASFGCGADSQLTWFGKAFLVDGLNHSTDFFAAFADASRQIAQWERRDRQTPSQPQLWQGALIAAKLAQWRAGLPANAAAVPFVPTRKVLVR